MATPIQFHLDESVPEVAAAELRLREIDVTVSRDVGLLGSDDLAQFQYACGANRVLVTFDADFLVVAATAESFPGIVFGKPRMHGIGEVVRGLTILARKLTAEEMVGMVVYLAELLRP